MTKRQQDGPGNRATFRTERMFSNGGQWYFFTREGTTEGPFPTEVDAQDRLGVYKHIMELELLSEDRKLKLQRST